jgi:hypothetical protein
MALFFLVWYILIHIEPTDLVVVTSGIQEEGNMSYCQATVYKPHGGLTLDSPLGLGRMCKLLPLHSACQRSSRSCKLQEKVYPRFLVAACHKRLGPVYASSGKENLGSANDVSSLCSFLVFNHFFRFCG